MPLLLSRDELKPLLDLTKAIELIEDAHKQQANGQIVPHAPYHIPLGSHSGLRIVSGAVLGARRVGVRLGPNLGLGGGDKMYATLFDAESGELLSFMGFPFGTLRTAAVVAQCAQALSKRARLSDVVGRLGPREFAVLAPATGPDGAVKLAHRMVQWVTAALATDPQAPSVRMRAGYDAVVNVAYEPLDPAALLLRAATALRGARSGGADWLKRFEEGARRDAR